MGINWTVLTLGQYSPMSVLNVTQHIKVTLNYAYEILAW